MAGRGRRRAPPPGFTLIEVLLVLVLLGIAGVLVAPAVSPALDSVRSEASARRAASFLDDARLSSVLAREPRTVRCLPDENRLTVLSSDGQGEAKSFAVPAGGTIASCRPEQVRYRPQGSAGGFELELRGRRGEGYRITVGAFTGLARLERLP